MSFANNERIRLIIKSYQVCPTYTMRCFSLTIMLLLKAMHFGRNTDRNGHTKNRVGSRRLSSKIAGLTENPARHAHAGNSITFPVTHIHFTRHVFIPHCGKCIDHCKRCAQASRAYTRGTLVCSGTFSPNFP